MTDSALATGLAATTNTPADSTPAPASSPAPASPISIGDHFKAAGVGEESGPPLTPEAPAGEVPTIAEPPPGQTDANKEGQIHWDAISKHPAHLTAVEKARTQAASETEQRLMQQWQAELEPVKQYVPVAAAIAQDVQAGTIEGWARLTNEYLNHPQLGSQVRSALGRELGRRPQPSAAPAPETEPEADLQTADGEPVYSAKQLKAWHQWNARQQEQRFHEQFAPVQEIAQQVKQVRETQQQTRQYVQQSQPLLTELQALPGFTDHTKEIAEKQSELFAQAYQRGEKPDVVSLWFRAYREIVPAKLQQQQHTQLVQSATAKAAGRTDNPASVAASPPPPPKDLAAAFKQFGVYGQ